MYEVLITIRNAISRFFYKLIAKPIFFQMDPENIHKKMISFGKLLGSNIITKLLTSFFFSYKNKKYLHQKILGIDFENPVGLAAGFDKDANMTDILLQTGFGFGEIGSITGESCKGNPKPRLWRLKKSNGLIINYGLNNEGCEKIAEKLKRKSLNVPLGISIAKTNCKKTANTQNGIADYKKAYNTLKDFGNFLVINISCPNAFGGEPFTDSDKLEKLLTTLQTSSTKKPVFLKMPPDLKEKAIDEILEIAEKHKIKGFICTNLTKDRKSIQNKITEKEISLAGGVSGKPIENLSNQVIKYIYKKTKNKYIIIGCGGIFSASDAYKKIKLGASLVQLITGMIFEGPQLISKINQGLVKLLKKDGFKNIKDAIGVDNK